MRFSFGKKQRSFGDNNTNVNAGNAVEVAKEGLIDNALDMSRFNVEVDADVEGVIEKVIDSQNLVFDGKLKAQILQEEKRKNMITALKVRAMFADFGSEDERRVGKTIIQGMLATATKYVYITTPYLIIDNELCASLENAALRGVDVRIIVPHIPDKKIVFNMTKSFYKRFIDAGVKIYEYEPGFIHAKTYLSDDKYAIIGTINLDYRSLVHHFENGVWIYNDQIIKEMKVYIDLQKYQHYRRFLLVNEKSQK